MSRETDSLPILPAGHPRIYLTRDTIPNLRSRMEKEQNAAAVAYYRACLTEWQDGVLPPVKEKMARPTNADSHLLSVLECHALEYLLSGDRKHGEYAISAMRNYHRTVSHYDYNTEGEELYMIGLIYDWCYDCTTEEDRAAFFAMAEETAGRMEMGYPEMKQGYVTGHGVEGQVMRDLMCCAVAMADEHPALYRRTAEVFFSEMVPAKKFFYRSGMYPQGSHYIAYRMQWELLARFLWSALGIPFVFGEEQKDPLYWFLYLRRTDGMTMTAGDDSKNNHRRNRYYTGISRSMLLAGNGFGDPYLKGEGLREFPFCENFTEHGNQTHTVVEFLLSNNPDLPGRSVQTLPLSRYFPEPAGEMIARTGWEDGLDAPVAVAQMKVNCHHTANHQHLDGGAFQIWYKGNLAVDDGYYQAFRNQENAPESGNTNYGYSHFANYYRRTVAHNCMLVTDPAEEFGIWRGSQAANDGGQRFPHGYHEAKSIEELTDPASGYHVGDVLAHGMGPDPIAPDYTYLMGNLKPAYSDKVKAYERSFLFLNLKTKEHPALLLVYDRVVSADPAFRKAFLLHTLERPEKTAVGYRATDTREGRGGQLSLGVLLPEQYTVTVIGGEGHQHEVQGVNYLGRELRGDHLNEGHGWRMEISPAEAREEDRFLTVLQMADGGTEELPISAFDAGTHLAALVGDRLALFGKMPERVSALSFNLPGNELRMAYATGLSAGIWSVNGETVMVGEEDGVAVFRAAPGENRLERTADLPEPPEQAEASQYPAEKTEYPDFGINLRGEMIYTPHGKIVEGDFFADPAWLARRLGYLLTFSGETAILVGDGREARLPVRVENGVSLVSISGLARAFALRARYDRFARLLYLS